VRAVRVRIPDPLDNGAEPLVVELLDPRHGPVEPGVPVAPEREDFVGAERDARAPPVVRIIPVRDEGVEPVVPSRELDNDEDLAFVHPADG